MPPLVSEIVDVICGSRNAFEQYHAMSKSNRLFQKIVEKDSLDFFHRKWYIETPLTCQLRQVL
ncbi:hypothetical protein GF337_07795 [candidate division KSB1 bacterium]|nr:hypothetical protein [candidate division KSB1 bacterium]